MSITTFSAFGITALIAATTAGLATSPTVPAAAVAAASATSVMAAETYEIDAVHSAVLYRIKHLNAAYNYGRFNEMSGTFTIADATLSLDVTINTESVDSANGGRDDHLRSPDFFNTKQFPTATFKSTSARVLTEENEDGYRVYEVTGDFTLNGETESLTMPVVMTGKGTSPRAGKVAGVEAMVDINRSEFGITTYPGMLGEKVRLIVALEGKLQ